MDDFISRFYKRVGSGMAKLIIAGAVISLVVLAFELGFAFDFGNCFGQATCSNGAGYYFLLLPLGVIVGSIFLLHKWRRYKADRYKEQIKDEVLQEMGDASGSKSTTLEGIILELLRDNGELSLETIITLTNRDKETIVVSLRELMKTNLILQRIEHGTSLFSLKD